MPTARSCVNTYTADNAVIFISDVVHATVNTGGVVEANQTSTGPLMLMFLRVVRTVR